MRALEPDIVATLTREGVDVAYEVFGSGDRTIVFPPIDSIVDSRAWKAQVPFLARHARVVTIDPRGNGRSGRPTDPAAYADTRVRRRHDRGDGRTRHRVRRPGRHLHVGMDCGPDRRASSRSGSTASSCSRRGCRSSPPPHAHREAFIEGVDRRLDRLGQGHRRLSRARLPRVSRVLLRRTAVRTAFVQAVGGLRRVGAAVDRPDPEHAERRADLRRQRRRRLRPLGEGALPSAGDPR